LRLSAPDARRAARRHPRPLKMGLEKQANSPSPALRERVPSAARQVRVSGQFIYKFPIPSVYGQPEGATIAAVFDRCRATNVVRAAPPAPGAIQVPPPASDWRIHRRLRLHRARTGNRTRWRSAFPKPSRHEPDRLAGEGRLDSDQILEQRRSQQYEWSDRD